MALVSVTRLRIRALRYLLQFVLRASKASSQARRASGFLGGRMMVEAQWTFWTVTAWEGEKAMRAFRSTGAHGAAMPELLNWCDEASVVHWSQDDAEFPDWQEAHRRMATEGRPSKFNHPSPAHRQNQIAEPRPGRLQRELKPAQS